MPRFEEFYSFMRKRDLLRQNKEAGLPWPWSDDEILNTYKFTNVKREHDRTTRWMRGFWTGPNASQPYGEIIFNCALFRYFGTIEFASAIGWQRTWDPQRVIEVAEDRVARGDRVFTGAYIIPTLGQRRPKHEVVARAILSPLWEARDELAAVSVRSLSWRTVADRLMELPGFGGTGFMAKEVLLDVMQTPVLQNARDKDSWCPAGPGARRGLNRVFRRALTSTLSQAGCLSEMLVLFEERHKFWMGKLPVLELHDIQFQLCEFDKYERARLGEGRPKAKYAHPR